MKAKVIEPAFRRILADISSNCGGVNRLVDKANVFALLCDSSPGLPVRVEIRQHEIGGCFTKYTQPLVEDSFENRSWSTCACTAIDECIVTGAQWQLRYQHVAGLGRGRRLPARPNRVPHMVEGFV